MMQVAKFHLKELRRARGDDQEEEQEKRSQNQEQVP